MGMQAVEEEFDVMVVANEKDTQTWLLLVIVGRELFVRSTRSIVQLSVHTNGCSVSGSSSLRDTKPGEGRQWLFLFKMASMHCSVG